MAGGGRKSLGSSRSSMAGGEESMESVSMFVLWPSFNGEYGFGVDVCVCYYQMCYKE